jgi:hypothetical protein
MKAEVYFTVSGDTQITIMPVSSSEMVSGLSERTAMLHKALPALFKSCICTNPCKRIWPSLALLLSHDNVSNLYDHMNHPYSS